MPYSGPGQTPYWITIQNNGSTSNAGMQSEQIPVTVGGTYQFSAALSYKATYASGAKVTLAVYNSAGAQLAAASPTTVTNMTAGQLYTATTGSVTAPSGAAYALATVTQVGLPALGNLLSAYQAQVNDGTNTAVNINYAFTWNYWPWSAINNGALSWQYSPLVAGDFDSLVLDGKIELMGGAPGVQSAVPELLDSNGNGPVFRILAPPSMNAAAMGYQASYDLNAPQPTQDVVASMLLDGERPFGTRSSNRQMSIPIIIFGTLAGGMKQVLAAREYLMSVIDQQTWTMKWTSADTGLPMLFDCFRALPSVPVYGFNQSAGGAATGAASGRGNSPVAMITITVQALPFGRSDLDGIQSLQFTNGLVSGPALPASVTIDNFSTFTSNANWQLSTTTNSPLGGNCVTFTTPQPISVPYASAVYTATLPTAVSIGGLPILSLLFGQVYDGQWGKMPAFQSRVTVAWTLTDSSGNKLSFSTRRTCRWSTDIRNPYWTQVNAAIPQNVATFNYSALKSYSVRITNWSGSGTVGYARMKCFMDAILAQPQTVSNGASPRGTVYNLFGLPGSARSPISVECQLPAAAPRVQEFTSAGTGTWQVPKDVYSIGPVEAWGGGGAGSSTASYGALVLESSPVLYAPLGANANDSSGNGYNGTATAVTFSQASTGIAGQASALFNGTTSKVTFPVNPYGGSAVTLSAWINGNGTAPVGRIIASSHTDVGTDKAGFELYANSSHGLTGAFGTSTSSSVISSTGTLPSSGWTHVAAVYDGAHVNVYINGAVAATAGTLSGGIAPGLAGLTSVGYGAANNSDFFTGLIQGVAVMNTALTAAQIAVLAQSGAAAGGGGGGGEYAAEPLLAVVPGTKVPWSVGAGGVPAQLSPTVIQFTKTGVLSHWTCPANVTSVFFEGWGGGAAGAAGGGGGGGGQYVSGTIAVTPGTTYWLQAGAGGTANTGITSASATSRSGQSSWFGNSLAVWPANYTPLISAAGGKSGLTGATPGGAGGSGGTGFTAQRPGGHGGSSPGTGGGGGGGAGGAGGPGGAGGDSPANAPLGRYAGGGTGGAGNGQGGNGGAGASSPGFPAKGAVPGGGGGGGYSGTILRPVQPVVTVLPDVNYLGADGGAGMVQLTYTVGSGAAVNGGSTSFGSAGTTGTTVAAHGGTSSAPNNAASAAGGSGSVNTVHNSGGQGGIYTSGPQGSWFSAPFPAKTSTSYALQLGASGTYTTASGTSGTASASCALGVSVVLVRSASPVSDLAVTDTAGNTYSPVDQQGGGSSGSGITTYAFIAPLTSPITLSTTITISSATAQAYGYLWYTSPYLSSGISQPNLASSSGTGSTITGTFGNGDLQTIQYELVVMSWDGAATITGGQPLYSNNAWFAPNATSSVNDTSGTLQAFIGVNQGGGTGATGSTGDAFSCGMSGSSNWSVICLPLVAAAQQSAATRLYFASGSSPGAQSAWQSSLAVSPNGMIAVVGMSVSAAPTAMSDASGNVYTRQVAQQVSGASAFSWMFTAPVTGGLAQGVSGHLNWGSASASPGYVYDVYWLPTVTGLDSAGVTTVTGSGTSLSGAYTPNAANDVVLAAGHNYLAASEHLSTRQGAPWNYLAFDNGTAGVNGDVFLAQGTDNAALSVTGTYTSATNWSLMMAGFTTPAAGAGGGAAGGVSAAGYPATYSLGAPGHAGGARGGNGAQSANAAGGGGALPGGGGGGSYSSVAGTVAYTGGAGGQGLIRITWQPPLTPFNTLVLHKPGEGAPPNFSPVVPIPVTDLPNNVEYTVAVPSLVPNLNAEFMGTYTVLLSAYSWNASTAGSARTLTVSINQYEFPGGPRYTVQASRAVTPATDVVNGIVNLGEVTLPIKDYADHNDQSYFTVSVMDSDQGDSFQDILFLDTTGQTAIINIAPGTPGYGMYVSYYIDEPTADRDLGFVGATTQGRQYQVSVLDYAFMAGGPLNILPGDNLLLAYSPAGAPTIGVTYAPRWFLDRIQ